MLRGGETDAVLLVAGDSGDRAGIWTRESAVADDALELAGRVGDVNSTEPIYRHGEGKVQLVRSLRHGGRLRTIETGAGVRRCGRIGRHAGGAIGGRLGDEEIAELSNARPVDAEYAAVTVLMYAAERDLAEAVVPGVGDVDVAGGTHGPARGAFRVAAAAGMGNANPQPQARYGE